MASPELFIFDCDGVLVDSEIVAARVEADLITAAGFPIEAEELARRYAGMTFTDIMMAIEKEAAIPFQASLIAEAEAMVDRRLAAEARLVEGAAEAVAGIGMPFCLCSNSGRRRIMASLERTGLAPLFEGRVYPADETPSKRPKPAPDVFLHAAAEMGATPGATLVLEDSSHGVTGAREAGMRVIGFTGASHSWPGHADALTEAGAETVIRRLSELRQVVAALGEWSEFG